MRVKPSSAIGLMVFCLSHILFSLTESPRISADAASPIAAHINSKSNIQVILKALGNKIYVTQRKCVPRSQSLSSLSCDSKCEKLTDSQFEKNIVFRKTKVWYISVEKRNGTESFKKSLLVLPCMLKKHAVNVNGVTTKENFNFSPFRKALQFSQEYTFFKKKPTEQKTNKKINSVYRNIAGNISGAHMYNLSKKCSGVWHVNDFDNDFPNKTIKTFGKHSKGGRITNVDLEKKITSPEKGRNCGHKNHKIHGKWDGRSNYLRRKRETKQNNSVNNMTLQTDVKKKMQGNKSSQSLKTQSATIPLYYEKVSFSQLYSSTIAPDVFKETSKAFTFLPDKIFQETSFSHHVVEIRLDSEKNEHNYEENMQSNLATEKPTTFSSSSFLSFAKTEAEKFSNDVEAYSSPSPTNQSSELDRFQTQYPLNMWKSLGFFDDSYLDRINIHWLKFEPPRPIVHKIFTILYGVFMVVGCGGNLLVIFMFFRCRSLRTPPNYLIVNLAISDFFMMAKTPIFIVNSFYHGPVLGAIGCKIYGFLGGLTGTTSIMTLASIALDRYYVIVHPLNPFKRTTTRRASLMIVGVWLYAAVFASLPLYGVNNYTSEGYLTSCSFDYLTEDFGSRAFIFVFFLAAWLFPLLLISFSYANIFRIVREAGRMELFSMDRGRNSGESFKFRPDGGKQKNEVKIAMLAGILISLWLLAWTPYALVALLGIFGWKKYLTPIVSSVPALFCKTASCINPFVYSMNHPKFQRELASKFGICFRYQQKKRNLREGSYYSGETCQCENEVNVKDHADPSKVDRVEKAPVRNATKNIPNALFKRESSSISLCIQPNRIAELAASDGQTINKKSFTCTRIHNHGTNKETLKKNVSSEHFHGKPNAEQFPQSSKIPSSVKEINTVSGTILPNKSSPSICRKAEFSNLKDDAIIIITESGFL